MDGEPEGFRERVSSCGLGQQVKDLASSWEIRHLKADVDQNATCP